MKRKMSSVSLLVILLLAIVLIVLSTLSFCNNQPASSTEGSRAASTGTTQMQISNLSPDQQEALLGSVLTEQTSTTQSPASAPVALSTEDVRLKVGERGKNLRVYREHTTIEQNIKLNGKEDNIAGEVYIDVYPQSGNLLQMTTTAEGDVAYLMRYNDKTYRSIGNRENWEAYQKEEGEMAFVPTEFFIDVTTDPLLEMTEQSDGGTYIFHYSGQDSDLIEQVKEAYGLVLTGFAEDEVTVTIDAVVDSSRFDIRSFTMHLKAEQGSEGVDVRFTSELGSQNNMRELSPPVLD